MKYFIVLSVIISQAVVRSDVEVTFTRKYCKELLASRFTSPNALVVDHTSNDLYFSHLNMTTRLRQSEKMNLNTKEVVRIPGIQNAWNHAINYEGREVYVGGQHGIYKYNSRRNTSIYLGGDSMFLGSKDTIGEMFYKDALYISTYLDQELYTFKNGRYRLLEDMKDTRVYHFVIDNDDTMFYSNYIGFYKQQKGSKDEILVSNDDFQKITGLAFDSTGDLYLAKKDGVYFVNKESLQLEKVVAIKTTGGIAFDKFGHLIYVDINIYRLIPKKGQQCDAYDP